MAVGLDGLASGLPTTELIASQLAVNAIPQTLLKNSATKINTAVAALQGLNTKLAALGTLAGKSTTSASLDFFTATSSSSKIMATAKPGATGGSIDIVVDKTAQAKSGVTAPMTRWSTPPVVTIVAADGTSKEVTAASDSLDDIVTAVNASTTGVTATKVASGTAPDGTAQFRLQFTGKDTGAAASFTVLQGTAAAGVDVLAQPGAALIRDAQDATLTLWKGTAAEQVVTSKTNTFDDLLLGVSITVTGASADPVTVSIARDTGKFSAAAQSLVDTLNDALAYIKIRSAVTASTDATGAPIASGGVFTGDGAVREVSSRLITAASAPLDGHSPSEYGISVTKTGTMEFNAEKFAEAFAKDPVGVQAAVAAISSRIAAASTSASDKTTGTISTKITGQQSNLTRINDQVAQWDVRLSVQKTNLERWYSAIEVQMSKLNAQGKWLTSQIDGLAAKTS